MAVGLQLNPFNCDLYALVRKLKKPHQNKNRCLIVTVERQIIEVSSKSKQH
jgi:hypothetical protein